MRIVRVDGVSPQPWRNGGGTTRELLAWPTSSDWLLRVSVARIERDGPFSAYPGLSRHFTVLAGAGVELSWHDRVVHLSPRSEPLAFDGADPPGCRLPGAATDDLNLMARADAGHSRLQRAEPGRAWQPHACWRGVYTHEAALLECDGSEWPLAAGTLAWDAEPDGSAWTLHVAPPGHAFWLSLHGNTA